MRCGVCKRVFSKSVPQMQKKAWLIQSGMKNSSERIQCHCNGNSIQKKENINDWKSLGRLNAPEQFACTACQTRVDVYTQVLLRFCSRKTKTFEKCRKCIYVHVRAWKFEPIFFACLKTLQFRAQSAHNANCYRQTFSNANP